MTERAGTAAEEPQPRTNAPQAGGVEPEGVAGPDTPPGEPPTAPAATPSTAPGSGAAPRSAPADHSSAPPAGGDMESDEDYVIYRPRLTVADGFRFGCGFITAVAVFYLVVLIALTLVYLIAVVLRLPVPGVPS